jgi:hypothetical protein
VNAGLVGLAVAVVAGGVLAVGARDSRLVVAGLAIAMGFAPLVANPLPAPLPLAARVVGAVLAAFLLWLVLRVGVRTRGSAVGWQADALVAAACAIAGVAAASRLVVGGAAGLDLTGADGPGVARGVPAALAAGFALGALAIGPLAAGRDVVRLGAGLLLAIHAALLIRTGLIGPPPALEQLVTSGLVVALAGAVAVLGVAALRTTGGFDLVAGRVAGAHRVARDGPSGSSVQVPASVVRRPDDRQARPIATPDVPANAANAASDDEDGAEAANADSHDAAAPGLAPAMDAEPGEPADPAADRSPARPISARSAGTRRIPGR